MKNSPCIYELRHALFTKSSSDLYLEVDAMVTPVFMDRYFVWPAVRAAGVFVSSGNASLPSLNPESRNWYYFSTEISVSSPIQTVTAHCNRTRNLTVF